MRVRLNGSVVADGDCEIYNWFGIPAFCPNDVRAAIEENPADEELVFEINSPGGDVWSGDEIYSVIRNAGCRTAAEVQSIAASAASYIMCACDEVRASPVAQIMIHPPMTVTMGNEDEHKGSIRILQSLRESILNAYQLKCGGRTTHDELGRLLDRSTWMPAQQALELGLVDSIIGDEAETLRFSNDSQALPRITEAMRLEYARAKAEREAAAKEQRETDEKPEDAPEEPVPEEPEYLPFNEADARLALAEAEGKFPAVL